VINATPTPAILSPLQVAKQTLADLQSRSAERRGIYPHRCPGCGRPISGPDAHVNDLCSGDADAGRDRGEVLTVDGVDPVLASSAANYLRTHWRHVEGSNVCVGQMSLVGWYHEWCSEQELIAASEAAFVRVLCVVYPGVKPRRDDHGSVWFDELAMQQGGR
jgi:hypothetical protein